MTCLQIQNIEHKAQSDLEKKDSAITELERVCISTYSKYSHNLSKWI